VPFTGKAGFSAYSHHVPEKGKMFILFAPHVGVEFDGKVGALRRINQLDVSTACGATIGAYNGLVKDAIAKGQSVGSLEEELGDERAYGVSSANNDAFVARILFIEEQLASRITGLNEAPDPVAYVTYAMYQLVREFFIDELLSAPGFWDYADEVTVLGGIMVNRGRGGDRFMPLMFQSRQQAAGTSVDLYQQTFGPTPDLRPVFGEANTELADTFYDYDLETTGERYEANLAAIRKAKQQQKKKQQQA